MTFRLGGRNAQYDDGLSAAEFSSGLDRIHAAGVAELYFVDRAGARNMLAPAFTGDPFARACAGYLQTFIAGIKQARQLCLTCEREIGPNSDPRVLSLLVSNAANGQEALVAGICRHCAAAAGWPGPGWRDRLFAKAQPVYIAVFGPLQTIALAQIAAPGSA